MRRRYVHPEALRNAIAHVVNAIFRSRATHIWGEGTTACASDAKQFGAWDQNLLTEWHLRYGGRGVMVYWHVEKRAVCIYSQLKTVSSSEVAAMLEGVLRHGTEMRVEKIGRGHAEVAQETQRCLHCNRGRRAFPMLTTLDQQGAPRIARIVETLINTVNQLP